MRHPHIRGPAKSPHLLASFLLFFPLPIPYVLDTYSLFTTKDKEEPMMTIRTQANKILDMMYISFLSVVTNPTSNGKSDLGCIQIKVAL